MGVGNLKANLQFCEARPDLNGALFLSLRVPKFLLIASRHSQWQKKAGVEGG
ncbi:hypothetical protein SAMN05444371_2839 [Epilithonimonas mollis]|uniref:Uncharacterized protein n=1 Tax=Epilithonimonas mollis TaxID=216903 RepID=A0A1M6TFP0_9FLAO|nr:hypothetical protein SAMN05444371_2839 [Epilithonimonas mollis]